LKKEKRRWWFGNNGDHTQVSGEGIERAQQNWGSVRQMQEWGIRREKCRRPGEPGQTTGQWEEVWLNVLDQDHNQSKKVRKGEN